MLSAVLSEHRVDAPLSITRERTDASVAEDPDPPAGMLLGKEGGELRAGHPIHHPVSHLQHCGLEPQLARRRGDLQPDVATAHDDEPPARRHLRSNPVDVVQGSQIVDSGEVRPGHRQLPGRAAGRQQEAVVRNGRAIVEPDAVVRAGQLDDAPPSAYLHPVVPIEVGGTNEQPLPLQRAGEILLGQRRPLVGHPGLFAHDDQLPREAFAA